MKYFTLASGDKIPAVGLGTWNASNEEIRKAVTHAIDMGYRHFDCAAIYFNEQAVGEAVNEAMQANKITRDEIFITSKLWNSFHKPEDVLPALNQSLDTLQLEYLDLYLIHWPVAFNPAVGLDMAIERADFLTLDQAPLIDTWHAMEQLVRDGLVKNIGVSNFSTKHLQSLLPKANIAPVMNQIECHPYLAQNELLKYCSEHQIHITAYSPLGSSGRPASLKQQNEPSLLENSTLLEIAEKHQASAAQIALAWQVHRGIIVIPKSSNPQRQQLNLAADSIALDIDDMNKINQLNLNHRFLDGTFFTGDNSPYTLEQIWNS